MVVVGETETEWAMGEPRLVGLVAGVRLEWLGSVGAWLEWVDDRRRMGREANIGGRRCRCQRRGNEEEGERTYQETVAALSFAVQVKGFRAERYTDRRATRSGENKIGSERINVVCFYGRGALVNF